MLRSPIHALLACPRSQLSILYCVYREQEGLGLADMLACPRSQLSILYCVCREQEGLGLADMLACPRSQLSILYCVYREQEGLGLADMLACPRSQLSILYCVCREQEGLGLADMLACPRSQLSILYCVYREQEGLGLADMLACPPTFIRNTGRYLQSFVKKPNATASSGSKASLSANERVAISVQDGTGWAVAVGVVTEVLPGNGLKVVLDKVVPSGAELLYRIDQVVRHNASIAYSNLADLCTSDGER